MEQACELDGEFDGSKCKVDKRIILIWLFPVIVALISIFFLIAYFNYRGELFGLSYSLEVFGLLIALFLLFGIPFFIWSLLRYNSINYIITRNEIIMNEGVLNKKRTVIPFIQIQDIYVRKPLLYRLIGLAYIEFETAGNASGIPEATLPGLSNADELVKDLLERVKKVRKTPETQKQDDHELLTGILEELKALRKRENVLQQGKPEKERLASDDDVKKADGLVKQISQILKEKELAESEDLPPEKKKPKVCLPVEKEQPDRLDDFIDRKNKEK